MSKIQSRRNGQDDDQSGQRARYDEFNATVAGRQSELDGQHNDDLGTLSLGERHNYDRDRPPPLPFSQTIRSILRMMVPFVTSTCPVRASPATSMRAERPHGRHADRPGTCITKFRYYIIGIRGILPSMPTCLFDWCLYVAYHECVCFSRTYINWRSLRFVSLPPSNRESGQIQHSCPPHDNFDLNNQLICLHLYESKTATQIQSGSPTAL